MIGGGQRAADLTRQLLAYAGKGRFYLERVDLSDVVIQTSRLFIPPSPITCSSGWISTRTSLCCWPIQGQMQQVVMNLIINAAEAIGKARGAILVRTGRQTVTGEPLPHLYSNEPLALRRVCISGGAGQRHRDGRTDRLQDFRSLLHDKIHGPRARVWQPLWESSGSTRGHQVHSVPRPWKLLPGAVPGHRESAAAERSRSGSAKTCAAPGPFWLWTMRR